jgi:simple sugar transport system permease protein
MRFERRQHTSFALALAAPVLAILGSMAICSLLVAWAGASALDVYTAIAKGAAGSLFALSETLNRATPLIFTGLSAACAFRAGFWNIGEEGQFYFGALAAVIVATGLVVLPAPLMVPFTMAVGAVAAGLLLFLSAILKVKLGVDEVVTSLLLNFVVLLLVSMLIDGPLKDPMGRGWPESAPVIDSAELPKLVPGMRLHAGFLIALGAAALLWLLNRFTTFGYESRAVGLNLRAAKYAGIAINTAILKVALLSGGLSGLGGVSEVIGLRGSLGLDLSPGFGYAGIIVAVLAQLHPIAVVASAILVAGIFVGADSMSRTTHVPSYIADVVVASSLLLTLLTLMFARYRLRPG